MTTNYGLCADCDKEVELAPNGHCSICQSSSTMKRGAISELEINIKEKKKELAFGLMRASWELVWKPNDFEGAVEKADRFMKALEEYKNV